jgi:hypothetical protein
MAIPASLAGIAILVGALMYPNMGEYRKKLENIAGGFDKPVSEQLVEMVTDQKEGSQKSASKIVATNKKLLSGDTTQEQMADRTVESEDSKPLSGPEGTLSASVGAAPSSAQLAAEILDEMGDNPEAFDPPADPVDVSFCSLNSEYSCDMEQLLGCNVSTAELVLTKYAVKRW